VPTVRVVGPGRAGSSLADALAVTGWQVLAPVHRHEDVSDAARGADLCVIATPDAAIAATAAAVAPHPATVVAHLAGSVGTEVLAPHVRRVAIHPLATLPDRVTGAAALLAGCWWAVEGDDLGRRLVADLGGRILVLPADPDVRAAYHAAACIAANHVVALLAQLERVTAAAGLAVEPFYDLAGAALTNARAAGARAALTGPASRGDWETVGRHLAALGDGERQLYVALASAAAALAGSEPPALGVAACR
jgi:predicted short-subunit dehydrogenase-like oxidoreductase (DUF2520 family)